MVVEQRVGKVSVERFFASAWSDESPNREGDSFENQLLSRVIT